MGNFEREVERKFMDTKSAEEKYKISSPRREPTKPSFRAQKESYMIGEFL
jgi:hypothetical protein